MHFQIKPANGFEWAIVRDPKDYAVFEHFDGSPRRDVWKPISVYRAKADDRQPGWPADFPWSTEGLVMRRRAVEVLEDILSANGEVLPLQTDDGVELFILNPPVLHALDEKRSEIVRFPGSDRIMLVETPVLIRSVVQGKDIFRLAYRGSRLYVSDRFVETVKKAMLTGLEFRPVSVS